MIALAIAALSAAPAVAADETGFYRTLGIGKRTCGAFVTALGDSPTEVARFSDWLDGYLSAYNRWVPGVSSIAGDVPMTRHLAWLETHCGRNPSAFFSKAAQNLVEFLAKR